MDNILALEVLGGPMDGLRLNLTNGVESARIGRQVGNQLALAFDMTISRWHASVKKEGKEFYLIDEKSVSGTWINGKRAEKKQIEPGMIFLLGGTIIEVFSQPSLTGNITIGDDFFENPLDIYKFSNELEETWKNLIKGDNEKKYCGIAGFIQQAPFYNLQNLKTYPCFQKIRSYNTRSVLATWINQCEIKPSYRFFQTSSLFTSPRMWNVLDIASKGNTEKVTFTNFLEAVLEEKRNLPARIISKDNLFLQDLKNEFKKKPNKQEPDPVKTAPSDIRNEQVLSSLIKFETILSGFMEDAIHSGMTQSRPQKKARISALKNLYLNNDSQILSAYLKKLEKNLIAILAAHRDSIRIFERELGKRIHTALNTEEKRGKGLFPMSESDKQISNAVKSVLKESELEGLTDRIVRQIVKNKITP